MGSRSVSALRGLPNGQKEDNIVHDRKARKPLHNVVVVVMSEPLGLVKGDPRSDQAA